MHVFQDPNQVAAIVGSDSKLRSGRHGSGEKVESGRIEEAPFVMTLLGPRIGKQNEDSGETRSGQALQQEARIVHEDPDISDAVRVECLDQLGDTVEKRLAPDKPGFWVLPCLFEQVLPCAKPNFQPNSRPSAVEQNRRIDRILASRQLDLNSRQDPLDRLAPSCT